MKLLDKFFNKKINQTRFEMITDKGNGFYNWNGKLYQSDIVRSCIRPMARAVMKTVPKHIRELNKQTVINPEPYIKFLLQDPNPYMTTSQLLEKIVIQFELNNNAFIYIHRDENGYPIELYPIMTVGGEAIYDSSGNLYIKFFMENGKNVTYPYQDIIHIKQDCYENDIFGENMVNTLRPLMEVVTTTDQGIIKAIKNSGIIRWLLKFSTNMRQEDIIKETEKFADSFLNTESKGTGVAGIDSKSTATQVNPNDYVPNAAQMDRTTIRLYNIFGTNEKIVQNKFNEDEWNAYYEGKIEPFLIQLSEEFTRKIFNRRERSFGNAIIFEAFNLQYASMSTKLQLVQFVDRAMMSTNEVRKILNLGPTENGDLMLLRKDTGVVSKNDSVEGGEE